MTQEKYLARNRANAGSQFPEEETTSSSDFGCQFPERSVMDDGEDQDDVDDAKCWLEEEEEVDEDDSPDYAPTDADLEEHFEEVVRVECDSQEKGVDPQNEKKYIVSSSGIASDNINNISSYAFQVFITQLIQLLSMVPCATCLVPCMKWIMKQEGTLHFWQQNICRFSN